MNNIKDTMYKEYGIKLTIKGNLDSWDLYKIYDSLIRNFPEFLPKQAWSNNFGKWDCNGASTCLGQNFKYLTINVGVTIPNPITLTAVGIHGVVNIDQFYQWYIGLGMDAAKSPFGYSITLAQGRFSSDQLPEYPYSQKTFLESFLSGWSGQGFLGAAAYFGINYSHGVADTELGLGYPQLGGGFTYSWKIYP